MRFDTLFAQIAERCVGMCIDQPSHTAVFARARGVPEWLRDGRCGSAMWRIRDGKVESIFINSKPRHGFAPAVESPLSRAAAFCP
jgi:hypothetical protein